MKKINKIELYEAELERIRLENDGVLNPGIVVDVARAPKNILHSRFTWDDTEAAEKYRIWQARQLISMVVTIMPNETKPVRAYVSLKDDRIKIDSEESGGYRLTVDVLNDNEMRVRMLKEAFTEFKYFREKYNHLKSLAPLFEAMEKIELGEKELQEV